MEKQITETKHKITLNLTMLQCVEQALVVKAGIGAKKVDHDTKFAVELEDIFQQISQQTKKIDLSNKD